MSEQKKKILFVSIDRINETYRDHPCMRRVNLLKEQLKQERLKDKIFCQSIKEKKAAW
jgi:hypothetical protein